MSEQKVSSIKQLIALYHQHIKSGDQEEADILLKYALQVPSYRGEALICKGLKALEQKKLSDAFLYFSAALMLLPKRTDIMALIAHSIQQQGYVDLAISWLKGCLQRNVLDKVLRTTLYSMEIVTDSVTRNWEKIIYPRLSEINDSQELRTIFDFISSLDNPPAYIGVVRFLPKERQINGWVINVKSPNIPANLELKIGKQKQFFVADGAHPLLVQAEISSVAGLISLSVPESPQLLSFDISVNGKHLLGSPLAIFPFFDPFLVKEKVVSIKNKKKEPVDILIPVYLGKEETLSCINSVLKFKKNNITSHRVIVLDDASPDKALSEELMRLARSGKIQHIRQPANLGFIRNMNRGMLLHPNSDVVWLNSDTKVHGNWLDRLYSAAYSAKDIASVTPFTNNGELMSFPISRVSHEMPTDTQLSILDNLASKLNINPVSIETGCGFCLYIKRSALDNIGYLDEVDLLRGYGEETDWCLRASKHGWRHVGAVNTFVAHQGGVSFGAEKLLRVAHNNALLRKRYPRAESDYKRFSLLDPLRSARIALQRARLHSGKSKPSSLLILPESNNSFIFNLESYVVLSFRNKHSFSEASLKVNGKGLPILIQYKLPVDWEILVEDLKALDVLEIVYAYTGIMPNCLMDLPSLLECSYGVKTFCDSLLDYVSFCANAAWICVPHMFVFNKYKKKFANVLDVEDVDVACGVVLKKEFSSFIIGDDLRNEEVFLAWNKFICNMILNEINIIPLLPENTVAEVSLSKIGVFVLPDLDNLSLVESTLLSNCGAVVSLDKQPCSAWPAICLANDLQLPLYAPSSMIAQQMGIHPIESLPFFTSSLVRDICK